VHNRDVLTGVEELMRALDDQVRAGKILYPRSLGLSGMGDRRKPTPPPVP
jgi:aryl-alcohol dehydrogenase-like predicted oxidoreductase